MNNSITHTPRTANEPVRSYAPGSPERASLKQRLQALKNQQLDIPAFIGGEAVRTGRGEPLHPPHERSHTLGVVHYGGEAEVKQAIEAALEARHDWARMPWPERAAIFLKAADLLAGPWRDTLNAASMLGQSKNVYQAEIDAACEMIDFLRFNVSFAEQIYADQPYSPRGAWNRMQYRPLEGFVFAVTPFNFTSIQGNLPLAPALMGNTVLWKPATSSVYSAYFTYKLMEAAGLPPGVVNMVPGHGADVGDPAFASPHLTGLHFTGSTGTFQHMWRTIGQNIAHYRTYPRIVGETGGKDFIVAHASAPTAPVATAIVRGAFEYQGQKCSAASRVYLPRSRWNAIRDEMLDQLSQIKMGTVEDFSNFMNAVIDRKAFQSITGYIDRARQADGVEILFGGGYSDEAGFFIEPTVLLADDPHYESMCEEIFGPVVTLFVYPDERFEETLELVDTSSPYALTGAVVGQQPFGGARASGTNDKAGSPMNLLRWVSARSIKETFDPPSHFAYPFMAPEEAYAPEADVSMA